MKTRTSILAVLASGILLSSGGVALGVSGLAAGNSAATAQYSAPSTGQTLPAGGTQTPSSQGGTQTPSNQGGGGQILGASTTAPTKSKSAAAPQVAAVAQTTRQQSLGKGQGLPFTGYAAIPVLLLGLGLLGAGVVMRRRTIADERS